MNWELLDVQAGFKTGRGTRDQIANIYSIVEKAREFQKNTYHCFIDYVKVFECVNHNNLWKILKDISVTDHLTCLLRSWYVGKKQQLDQDMEQLTGSKLGKKYDKAIQCHPAYLNYMQSISWEIMGWINHSWNQDWWKKYQEPQICRWSHPNGRKWRGTEVPFYESERGEWKTWLETQNKWGNSGGSDRFYCLGL